LLHTNPPLAPLSLPWPLAPRWRLRPELVVLLLHLRTLAASHHPALHPSKVGLNSPFDRVDPDGPACTSFDGMLAVSNEPKYKGLQRHIDVYAWEPSQMTARVVLQHPPPARLRRLGIAVQ
jgi:hypothetical protein